MEGEMTREKLQAMKSMRAENELLVSLCSDAVMIYPQMHGQADGTSKHLGWLRSKGTQDTITHAWPGFMRQYAFQKESMQARAAVLTDMTTTEVTACRMLPVLLGAITDACRQM